MYFGGTPKKSLPVTRLSFSNERKKGKQTKIAQRYFVKAHLEYEQAMLEMESSESTKRP
jgi:hypothetical protein